MQKMTDGYKPTKKELSQVYYLEQEIQNLQMIIEDISDVNIKSPMSSNTVFSPTGTPSNPTAITGSNLAELSNKLKELQQQCKRQRIKILKYIENMDDSYMRQIVLLRCLKLYTWQEVADAIKGGNTAATCCMAFHRTFK